MQELTELAKTLYLNKGPVAGTLSPVLFLLCHKIVLNLFLLIYKVRRIYPLSLFSGCYKYRMRRTKLKRFVNPRFSPSYS